MESRQFRRDGSLCYKEGCVQCNDRLVETQDKQQQVCFHVVISSGSFFHLWKQTATQALHSLFWQRLVSHPFWN